MLGCLTLIICLVGGFWLGGGIGLLLGFIIFLLLYNACGSSCNTGSDY